MLCNNEEKFIISLPLKILFYAYIKSNLKTESTFFNKENYEASSSNQIYELFFSEFFIIAEKITQLEKYMY